MPRYILIDNGSGFIFGDTADVGQFDELFGTMLKDVEMTPSLAAMWVDHYFVGVHDRKYEEHDAGHVPASSATAYHVHRADVQGSEAVPIVQDGQDRDTIAAVLRDCPKVAVVTIE